MLVAAAAVRFSTLGLQSLWFDEAYTPVRDLHTSLGTTLSVVAGHENTPPLWYVLIWAETRLLGTSVIALRLPSALAGVALVCVGWRIGEVIGSRRVAITLAALLAFNPLFVWYSQEARAYELFALLIGLSLLFFLQAWDKPSARVLAAWSIASILALLTEYFAVFLIAGEAGFLMYRTALPTRHGGRVRRHEPWLVVAACAGVGAVGAALVPLLIAQGGRGTNWIRSWPLGHRLVSSLGYYLLGYNGAVLGHTLLLLCALPLAASVIWLARSRDRAHIATAWRCLAVGTIGIGAPLALALAGFDYLAPRNIIGCWVALSAFLATALDALRPRAVGTGLAAVVVCVSLGVVVATDLDSRLQRGDWRDVARAIHRAPRRRAIVTVEDGAAPLEYYLPDAHLEYFSRRRAVLLSEVDIVGYAPVPPLRSLVPAAGFVLSGRLDVHGLRVLRFVSRRPFRISGATLRDLTIPHSAIGTAEVLVPRALQKKGSPAR
ncbi:MAG TPA: glycosyltransferase family 39 protein [Solirubrobacteraceae bacterium]|nr:glycosyltransferase family 39 protein [Solirubrobacteraceae bacterium]